MSGQSEGYPQSLPPSCSLLKCESRGHLHRFSSAFHIQTALWSSLSPTVSLTRTLVFSYGDPSPWALQGVAFSYGDPLPWALPRAPSSSSGT